MVLPSRILQQVNFITYVNNKTFNYLLFLGDITSLHVINKYCHNFMARILIVIILCAKIYVLSDCVATLSIGNIKNQAITSSMKIFPLVTTLYMSHTNLLLNKLKIF